MCGAVLEPALCCLTACRKWGNKLKALSEKRQDRRRPLGDAPRRLLRISSDTSEPIWGHDGGNNQCKNSQPARIVRATCVNGGGRLATTTERVPHAWKLDLVAQSRT